MKDCENATQSFRDQFRKHSFWMYYDSNNNKINCHDANAYMNDSEKSLRSEILLLEENTHLCKLFGLDDMMNKSKSLIDEMESDLSDARHLWYVNAGLSESLCSLGEIVWTDIDCEKLDLDGKAQLKSVQTISSSIRWSDAYKDLERQCKNFIISIPLISLLKGDFMRLRHWNMILTVTNGNIVPPSKNSTLKLNDILSLQLYKFNNEIEEICDQAAKEDKMEW